MFKYLALACLVPEKIQSINLGRQELAQTLAESHAHAKQPGDEFAQAVLSALDGADAIDYRTFKEAVKDEAQVQCGHLPTKPERKACKLPYKNEGWQIFSSCDVDGNKSLSAEELAACINGP